MTDITTSAASIPYVNDGIASFSIKGTAAVGNTLSINEDKADSDGTGTLFIVGKLLLIIPLGKKLALVQLIKLQRQKKVKKLKQ